MLDLDSILRFVAAFALVIGLIALMSYGAKRWRGFGRGSGRAGRRLEVVEALGLDAKRRLVIVRADAREYVLLVGGEADLMLGEARPAGVGETSDAD